MKDSIIIKKTSGNHEVNHSWISLIFSIFSLITLTIIVIIDSHYFWIRSLIFSIVGFVGLQLLNKEWMVIPKKIKKLDWFIVLRDFFVLLFSIVIIGSIAAFSIKHENLSPFAIDFEIQNILIVLAAPAYEEIFYRGFILTLCLKLKEIYFKLKKIESLTSISTSKVNFLIPNNENTKQKSRSHKINSNDTSDFKKIGLWEIIIISFQATIFSISHEQYKNNPVMIIQTLVAGIILGFHYILKKDVTTIIMVHFFVNLSLINKLLGFIIGAILMIILVNHYFQKIENQN